MPETAQNTNLSPVVTQSPPVDSTPPPIAVPQKPKSSGRLIGIIIGILVLVGGVVAGVILVQQQQELREKAQEGGEYGWDGTCYNSTGGRIVNLYRCSPSEYPGSGQCGLHGEQNPCFDRSFCGVMQLDVACLPGDWNPDDGNDTWEEGDGSDRTCEEKAGRYASTQFLDNRTAACGSPTTPPGGTPPGGPPPSVTCNSPCTQNSDCTSSAGGGNWICLPSGCYDAQMCGSGPGPTEPPTGGPCGSTCSQTSQCTDGSTCWQGKCINPMCKVKPGNCNLQGCTAVVECEQTDCRIGGSVCSAGGTCNQSTGVCECGTVTTAQCLEIKVYDTNWSQITNLSGIRAGTRVRFVVKGSATSGTFDQARFTINGVLRPAVTTTRPGTTDEFYDEFVIPAQPANFGVSAQVHHAVLNQWF